MPNKYADDKFTYDIFKSIYGTNKEYFTNRKGKQKIVDDGGYEDYDYYEVSKNANENKGLSLSKAAYDKYAKQFEDEKKQSQAQLQQQALTQNAAKAQEQSSAAASAYEANSKASMDAEMAKLQQQLAASQTPQAAGAPTPTPIEQIASQYQKQITDYQKQLSDSQTTLFTQLAQQQAQQQQKAADMFGGYQQYTDQLKNDWQAGLKQTQDLIGGLQTSYQNQLTGLQGVFQQSLAESRAARETEEQERARIQGLLEQQAAAAVESKNSQQRFQQSAELIAAKKQQDLTRSFNRASSQATFGVLSNQRRRGGASQTIFSDSGTTSQNPYGYSNIFFS